MNQNLNTLRLRHLGIDMHEEAVVFMRDDCHVCRAEGLTAQARVAVTHGSKMLIATLSHVSSDLLGPHDAGLSESAWGRLGVVAGDEISISHAPTIVSLGHVRAKIYGHRLEPDEFVEIIGDIVAGHYSDIELASFLTACAAGKLDQAEMISLTRAMVAAGSRLDWGTTPVVDKHCVGGLPGNRTTPIVVAIVTACGLTMPKTSSRAITSPAGTADTMATLTTVDLDLAAMRRVVEREGGCIVWGGSVHLSPADDMLIRVERALDLDTEAQLVASVLSKKAAAGATHVVLDLPVGPTAKVRSSGDAERLGAHLKVVADALGLTAEIVLSDGRQPVGRGIGPALEARDVLAVLRGQADAPDDLRQRALRLAGAILELGGREGPGTGMKRAAAVLGEGLAWRKFQQICEAQGGLKEPPRSRYRQVVTADRGGRVTEIDNRRLARVAKLSGAPEAKAAGVELHTRLKRDVEAGQPLFTIHSESQGELGYALGYLKAQPAIVRIEGGR